MHLLAPFINIFFSILSHPPSTIQEVTLTGDDVEFIAKVNREISGYLNCLEKIKYAGSNTGKVSGYLKWLLCVDSSILNSS